MACRRHCNDMAFTRVPRTSDETLCRMLRNRFLNVVTPLESELFLVVTFI
jgi:hypothetical protein